jgi:hypothetical protein
MQFRNRGLLITQFPNMGPQSQLVMGNTKAK